MDIIPETKDFDRQFEQVGWGILTVPQSGLEHDFSVDHAAVRLTNDIKARGLGYFVYDPKKVEVRTVVTKEELPDDRK